MTSAFAEPSSIAALWTPALAPTKALVEVAEATVSLTPASTTRGKLVAATALSVSWVETRVKPGVVPRPPSSSTSAMITAMT